VGQPLEGRGEAEAGDGRPLAVTRFRAKAQPWATMLVAGAMGVRQDFYAPVARFFAQSGVHAMTFDYRGVGASRRGPLSKETATVTDWADQDMNAMLGEAWRAAPDLPLIVLGHSLGGQIVGLLPDNDRVRAVVAVVAGSGWYRHNERMKLGVRFLWHVAVPALTPVFGYFPGKALRMVGDMPRGVAYQWRRWCMHRDYLLSEGEAARDAYRRFAAPMLSYSFEDDPMITRAAVDDLVRHLASSRVTRRHVAPGEMGARRIGHFGYFAEASRDTLWRESLAWLRETV
jgi:predicted alpha/beta hydrolase